MKYTSVVVCFCLFLTTTVAQTNKARVREYQQTFTTYPFSDPNPIPMVFSPVYPYFRYDGFTSQPEKKSWKVVELENDYIRVLILPEIGGKVWAAIEKSGNRPFIYYNHVVKFRDVAMRGPWTSGGLEANYGIIGHTPNCATPVDYKIQENADNSVSCIIGTLDLLTRSQWRVEINLPADKAYFTTRSFWYNGTPLEQPYYHWMNTGIKASGNLEFIYPGNRYIGHEGEYAEWPVNKNGKHINWYEQNNFGGYKSYHVFGKYTDFFGAFWHDDDFGFARYSTHDDKAGKKIWIWGLSQQGMIWEKLLTDSDGQYVEVQSGRLFNQNSSGSSYTPFKHHSLEPYATENWKEYWYPVLQTGGFREANEYGAMNIDYRNGWLVIHFCPVQFFTDTIEIKSGEKIIYSNPVSFKPLQTFKDSVKVEADPSNLIAAFKIHPFLYQSAPGFNELNRPVETVTGFDWNSAYGLFVQGKEWMDQKYYAEAEGKLLASLGKDSNFLPCLVKLSELYFRKMRYREALDFAVRALRLDTHDGAANYYYGMCNMALDQIVDAKDGFDLASLSYEYRSASFTQLCRIYFREHNYERAILYATRALDYHRFNMEALKLLAVIYRKQNQYPKADSILKTILTYDPLNHFAAFEQYMRDTAGFDKRKITASITNELPLETYLETGIWYFQAGCREEARAVFLLAPASGETEYWLSFLDGRPVNLAGLNPNFVFPFRNETGQLLETLLKKEDSWILKYHLALFYLDRNRIGEALKLLTACGNIPDQAPFYVVRAKVVSDTSQMRSDLLRAVSLDKGWRYIKLLTEYYNSQGQFANALTSIEKYYKFHPQQYIIGMLYAKTLLLNKKYRESDQVLKELQIIPFEGATDGRELYREAKLMQAVQMMQQNKYEKALGYIKQSEEWPENLGVGKPYEKDIDYRLEQWMTYLCKIKSRKTAEATVQLESIIRFMPGIENTISNFQASNALVTAWAYQELNRTEEANNWLNVQVGKFPDNHQLLWSRAKFQNEPFTLSEHEKNANVRIIEALLLLQR